MLQIIYRAVYDSLATVDVAGGVLLVAIWFQTGYVALFRAIHGDDAGRAPVPARARAPQVARSSANGSPWG